MDFLKESNIKLEIKKKLYSRPFHYQQLPFWNPFFSKLSLWNLISHKYTTNS